jgi:hypothetical protein
MPLRSMEQTSESALTAEKIQKRRTVNLLERPFEAPVFESKELSQSEPIKEQLGVSPDTEVFGMIQGFSDGDRYLLRRSNSQGDIKLGVAHSETDSQGNTKADIQWVAAGNEATLAVSRQSAMGNEEQIGMTVMFHDPYDISTPGTMEISVANVEALQADAIVPLEPIRVVTESDVAVTKNAEYTPPEPEPAKKQASHLKPVGSFAMKASTGAWGGYGSWPKS